MIGRKAQGTTEYLIILAVIIVIALVVVGVMGWVPGLTGGITEQQSRAYWQSTSPFSIKEFKFSGTTAELEVQNISANKLTLTQVAIDGVDGISSNVSFNAGESALISLTGLNACGTIGSGFDYNVSFTYDSKQVTGLMQLGDKGLIGKCN